MELCENVGCDLDVIAAHKSQSNFRQIQEEAWSRVRKAIDNKTPCYAWELGIPEFYVIYGYDDKGYLFRGPLCDSGKGPLSWKKLGDTGIGWIEIAIVKPADAPPDRQVVKEALLFATQYAKSPEKWTHSNYKGGLAAYDLWIEALQKNKADGFGMAFNAAVWAECRSHATDFLREAKERLDNSLSSLFDDAIGHYEEVSRNLKKVSETFPFMNVSHKQKKENMKDEERRRAAVVSLQAAREAEEKGLAILQQIEDKL